MDSLIVNASGILDWYLEHKVIPQHLKVACLKVKTEIDDASRRNESGRLYASTNMPLNIVAQMLLSPITDNALTFDVKTGFRFENPLQPRPRNLSGYKIQNAFADLGSAFI